MNPAAGMNDTTRILHAIGQGDRQAAEKLLPLVSDELRKLAAHRLTNEEAGQTRQAAAQVPAVDDALHQREREPAPAPAPVKPRLFAGMKNAVVCLVLMFFKRMAKRYRTFARAWLYQEFRSHQAS